MSACSTYFGNLVTSKKQVKLQLNLDSHVTFESILKYAYDGEVIVDEANFKDFMAALNAFEMVLAVKQVFSLKVLWLLVLVLEFLARIMGRLSIQNKRDLLTGLIYAVSLLIFNLGT